MKCPYHDCAKDYNPEWKSEIATIFATQNSVDGDGLQILTLTCRFCDRQFHEIYQHKAETTGNGRVTYSRGELLFTFPSSKTKFEAKKVPISVKDYFNEAERCRSIGSLTGAGACLRKVIYAVCDDMKSVGSDYREKISNLPLSGKYSELLKQVKWLGDHTTKPSGDSYSLKEVDLAIEILPLVIDKLYVEDEKIESVEKILAKVKSKKIVP